MKTKLSVNLNKVATLRNTRTIGIPSVVRAAELVLDAGAHGITLHPRPDERHIRPGDVYDIARLLERYPGIELNIEGNPFHGLDRYAAELEPDQVTLVPDSPDAFTSDHGWDVPANAARLREVVAGFKTHGCRVSLFMDADAAAMAGAAEVGADRVELYTEPYAAAFESGEGLDDWVDRFAGAARAATRAGLGINAGHDLNEANIGRFLAEVPGVAEVSIGHALIADALEYGLGETVRRYLRAMAAAGG
ncbi:MAG: pyridoxine 5'-phosphate synthase [Ectothiorhodospiraceae bacterium]|nr:pyridoxine 5'-phosphate synthase [Chromatiales bacterium]MCP5157252.1 pyridoxine 5'-phosphate synthase [Ectothiorhodospiraceae bacterium]